MVRILLILVLLSTTIAFSQEKTFETEVRKISKRIDEITSKHKDSLKLRVEEINKKLNTKELTAESADKLKMEAADYHAKQIELKVGVEELKLQQLVQDKVDGKIASENQSDALILRVFDRDYVFFENEECYNTKKRDKRTTSQFVVAMGVNNVLDNHNISSLNRSNYKFWQSHFYEVGFTFKTRFSKEPSKTYFKYGLSFLWNNLRAKNNQYHVEENGGVSLKTHPNNLGESRLRHVQMTFPMHLEFDFSENKKLEDEDKVIDQTHKGIRLGVGGFFGFKLGSRQYLEFVNDNGISVEEIQKGDFNMNTVNYGLSGYLAYKGYGLYLKYDLNPLFQNTNTRNISFGVRFDIN